jgi:hypothetical protein
MVRLCALDEFSGFAKCNEVRHASRIERTTLPLAK